MRNYFVAFFVLMNMVVWGQNYSSGDKKALKLFGEAKLAYESSLFSKSLQLLDEALEKDSCFFEVYLLKSDIFQELDSVALQIAAIEKALNLHPEKNPKLYYLLGNACFKAAKYQKAADAYKNYLKRVDEKDVLAGKARGSMAKCESAAQLLGHPVPFVSVNLGNSVNSDDDEYWPSLTVDGQTLVFTRLIGSKRANGQRKAIGQEDFYTSQFRDNTWQASQPLSSINTAYNEGAQTISSDGKLLFFTACTRNDGRGSCDIYFSQNRGGVWSVPLNAGEPVNSPAWESQPSISANGETLYFVSNRKGGKGGMDIWKCNLLRFSESGMPVWGYPVNLGDSVNTSGNEMSPFIHSDGKTLYFASDNWPGLGGSDIFYCRLNNDSVWGRAHNIGYPINTNRDEQGLIVDAAGRNAYYSSDRPGSRGMDIYSFELYPDARPDPVSYIKGKVIDEDSGEPLCAQVELIDLGNSKPVVKGESCREEGEFLLCLPLGKEYAFNVSKEGYLFYSENFQLKEKKQIVDPYILEIRLKKIQIGGAVVLRNVFFNTGSHELLPESRAELRKLADFMTRNNKVVIEIGGHTDNVGAAEMNQKLSELRAKEVYRYLVDGGIDQSRMRYNGYGLSQPVMPNDTPEGRALNRRTEFRIIRN